MGSSTVSLVVRARDRLRLRDLAGLSVESRARERYKRIGLTAGASLVARSATVAISLVSVPLTLHYLGTEQFGLWVTITSVTALLGFANLGLSNGLVSGVSQAYGRDDPDTARRLVSSAFYMLVGVAAALGGVFAASYAFIPWAQVFNVSADAATVAGPAVAMLVALTLLDVPLSVVPAVQAGLQEGFRSSLWQGAGSVVSLLGLLVVIAAGADLPWLVLALAGGPIAATAANGIVLFRRRSWLLPRAAQFTFPAARRMLRLGLMFFVLAVAGAVAYQTDAIVIAQLLGSAQVTQYAVPMKLFMLAPLVLGLMLVAIWPAYSEALARRDAAWVRRTFVRSLLASALVGALLSVLILIFARPLLHAWVGPGIEPTTGLLLALSAWAVSNCLTGPVAAYLNARNALGFQAVCAITMMVANLGLSIGLTHTIGISGPAWGSVIAQVVFVLLPCGIYMRSSLRRLG